VEDKVERSFWNEHRNNRGAKTGTQKNNQTTRQTRKPGQPENQIQPENSTERKTNQQPSGYIVSYQASETIEDHWRQRTRYYN
jgi:hypothetical protein